MFDSAADLSDCNRCRNCDALLHDCLSLVQLTDMDRCCCDKCDHPSLTDVDEIGKYRAWVYDVTKPPILRHGLPVPDSADPKDVERLQGLVRDLGWSEG
jgi:hypothetical protein